MWEQEDTKIDIDDYLRDLSPRKQVEALRSYLEQTWGDLAEARSVARDARDVLVEVRGDARVDHWLAVNERLYDWLTGRER